MENFHGMGKVSMLREKETGNLTPKGKEVVPHLLLVADLEGEMLWEILETEEGEKKTNGEMCKKDICKDLGLKLSKAGSWANDNSSPLAMCFDQEKGCVTEPLGPKSRHWKHLARKINNLSPTRKDSPSKIKCTGPVPLQELDLNMLNTKCRKGTLQVCEVTDENENMVGGEAVAVF